MTSFQICKMWLCTLHFGLIKLLCSELIWWIVFESVCLTFKGGRSCNLVQFQSWWTGYRTNGWILYLGKLDRIRGKLKRGMDWETKKYIVQHFKILSLFVVCPWFHPLKTDARSIWIVEVNLQKQTVLL